MNNFEITGTICAVQLCFDDNKTIIYFGEGFEEVFCGIYDIAFFSLGEKNKLIFDQENKIINITYNKIF